MDLLRLKAFAIPRICFQSLLLLFLLLLFPVRDANVEVRSYVKQRKQKLETLHNVSIIRTNDMMYYDTVFLLLLI